MELRPLVLFSGGLDSTFLVYDLLNQGVDVDVLYIDGGQGENKVAAERQAVAKLMKEFDEMYCQKKLKGRIINSHLHATFTFNIDSYFSSGFTFCQVLPWLTTAMQYATPNTHSAVYLAYCLGDQIGSELYRLAQAWELLFKSIKCSPLVPLEYPVMSMTKQTFLQRLPKSLLKHVWVCELPVVKEEEATGNTYGACGDCDACIRSRMEKTIFNRRKSKVEKTQPISGASA